MDSNLSQHIGTTLINQLTILSKNVFKKSKQTPLITKHVCILQIRACVCVYLLLFELLFLLIHHLYHYYLIWEIPIIHTIKIFITF